MVRIMRMRSQSVPVGMVTGGRVREKMIASINTFIMWNVSLCIKMEHLNVTNNELAGKLLMVRTLLRKSLASLTKYGG